MKLLRCLPLVFALGLSSCKPTARPPDPPPPSPDCGSQMGHSSPLRLLTRTEFDQTVRDLLGDTTHPALNFPVEPVAFGFDNNADLVKVTPEAVNRYLEAAEALSHVAVTTRRAEMISCPQGENADCGRQFVRTFGRKVFRRALTATEESAFSLFFSKSLESEQSFDGALEATLQVMLQSPQFLYRVEPSTLATAGVRPLTGDELASRLSYFLWGSMPDESLLDAAAAGQLDTVEGLTAQAQRLLADPRARDPATHFFAQWLSLDAVATLAKDPVVYPGFDATLASSLKSSLQQYASDAFFGEGTLKALLTSNAVFVDQPMANRYGLPASGTVGGFTRATDPTGHVSGLLSQPGLLARLASPDQSSPVRRGLFVLQKLMCVPISPPPPGFSPVPPAANPGKTTRERFAAHSLDPACAACHSHIDPIGFGFEHFDGIGAWRDTENGLPVDASGDVTAALDASLVGPFSTLGELSSRLSASRQVHDCVAVQWLRYALGRVEASADTCALQRIEQTFFDSGGRFVDLQLAIVGSDSFRYRAEAGGAP